MRKIAVCTCYFKITTSKNCFTFLLNKNEMAAFSIFMNKHKFVNTCTHFPLCSFF